MALKPEEVNTLSESQEEVLNSIEHRLDLKLENDPQRNSDGYIHESIDIIGMMIDDSMMEELEKRYYNAGWLYVYAKENRETQTVEVTLRK